MKHTLRTRLVAATLGTALLTGGLAALAPAATADSRCNTRDHTHGASFWKRTDTFLGTSAHPTPGWRTYHHSNSQPVKCRA